MILAVHFIAGAAISEASTSVLGLFFAFLSHYFLDFLPHREYSTENIQKKYWGKAFFDFFKVGLDVSLGSLFVLLITENPLLSFLGGFLAILPDGFSFLFLLFPKNKFLAAHNFFHKDIVHRFNIRLNALSNKKSFAGVLFVLEVFTQLSAIAAATVLLPR